MNKTLTHSMKSYITIFLVGILVGCICRLTDYCPADTLWSFSSIQTLLGFWIITNTIIVLASTSNICAGISSFLYMFGMTLSFYGLQAILGTFIPLFSGGFRTSLFILFTICSIPCAIAAFILYYWNKEHIFNSILYSLPVGALAAEAIVIFIYFLGHHTFLFQLGLILGLSIYSVRKDPKKGTQRLVSIGRSVLLGLLAGVLGVGLAALGIVSAGTAFIISAAIGLALKFFVDSVDDSKVRKATSGFTGTRVSTKTPTRSRRVAAQNLDGNAPVYNEIPALASGAVIPPNRKFLAVLGDQKSGTNVEAPLSTIKQAVMEAMAQGSREPINVNLVVDGKTLARVVVPNINNMTRAAGKPVLLY